MKKIATKPTTYIQSTRQVLQKLNTSGKIPTDCHRFVNLFKVKCSFSAYYIIYGLLSAIKNKWKISPTDNLIDRGKQNWYDSEDNLSNAALHKIIVEKKYQPLPMEWSLLKSKNYINDLFLLRKIKS